MDAFRNGLSRGAVNNMIEEAMSGLKRVDTYTGVTNGSGNLAVTFLPDFTTVEHIGVELVGVSDISVGHRIISPTLSGCTINVQRPAAIAVALIGLTVLTSTFQNVASQQIRVVVVGT